MKKISLLLLSALIFCFVNAQTKVNPVIKSYGTVFPTTRMRIKNRSVNKI
jgi:hypothetical protein